MTEGLGLLYAFSGPLETMHLNANGIFVLLAWPHVLQHIDTTVKLETWFSGLNQFQQINTRSVLYVCSRL